MVLNINEAQRASRNSVDKDTLVSRVSGEMAVVVGLEEISSCYDNE